MMGLDKRCVACVALHPLSAAGEIYRRISMASRMRAMPATMRSSTFEDGCQCNNPYAYQNPHCQSTGDEERTSFELTLSRFSPDCSGGNRESPGHRQINRLSVAYSGIARHYRR